MRNKQNFRNGSFLLILLLRLISIGAANAQGTETVVLDDDAIQQLLNENKIPALGIGVIKDGKLKRVKVYGELKKGETAPFNTIFNGLR